MCGICGILDLQASGDDLQRRLPAMVRTLSHRGPDASGQWCGGGAALGHTRLSIIDLSDDGKQPMCNEDGTVWISYNGEVYNFQPIREELIAKGHKFRSHCDTEVIIHLYEECGIEFVHRLRGMFGLALWDMRKRTMYLVRDRLGIKPVYYTVQGKRLIFGSEIKAILAHCDIPRAVDAQALSDYLTFLYVPAPKTMFQGIYKLPAGYWLEATPAGIRTQQYWDVPAGETLSDSRETIERELIERLTDAVRMRLVSDVPLGAFLSGGVDSSAVVAAMAKIGHRPIITESVGFNESAYNELPHARRVAEKFQTEHYEEVVQPEAAAVVRKLAWHYDEPFADYSAIPTFYVSQAARRHVTVALSGDGGDENFAGYRRYRFDLAERRTRQHLPGWFRQHIVRPIGCAYPKADWLPRFLRAKVTLQNIADDAPAAYCRSVGFISDDQKGNFLTSDLGATLGGYRSDDIIRHYMNLAPRGDLEQLLYADTKTYLVEDILTKVDRASMAVALEVRVPILDHKFVEYAHRIPPEMKISGQEGKSIFKSALRQVLDDDTIYRPKQGFTPPLRERFRGPLKEMTGDLLLAKQPAYGNFVRPEAMRQAWNEHQSGLRDYTPLLYAMLMFELWAQRFLNSTDILAGESA